MPFFFYVEKTDPIEDVILWLLLLLSCFISHSYSGCTVDIQIVVVHLMVTYTLHFDDLFY